MRNALVMDFYGTMVGKSALDSLLSSYAPLKDGKIDYDAGGSAVLEAISSGDARAAEEAKGMFYPGVTRLYQKAADAGLEVRVYSNGNGRFIEKAAELKGMKVRFVNPKVVGDKKQPDSYRTLRSKESYGKIIFVSDSKEEVEAAIKGEVDTAVLVDDKSPDYQPAEKAIDDVVGEDAADKQVCQSAEGEKDGSGAAA